MRWARAWASVARRRRAMGLALVVHQLPAAWGANSNPSALGADGGGNSTGLATAPGAPGSGGTATGGGNASTGASGMGGQLSNYGANSSPGQEPGAGSPVVGGDTGVSMGHGSGL